MKNENNGIDGSHFFIECIDEFEAYDLKMALQDLDGKSEKRVYDLANGLINYLGSTKHENDSINTGELVCAIKIFGAKVIQATMIQYNETEKEDLK